MKKHTTIPNLTTIGEQQVVVFECTRCNYVSKFYEGGSQSKTPGERGVKHDDSLDRAKELLSPKK